VAGVVASAPLVPTTAYANHDPLKHRQHRVHHDIATARGDLDESSRGLREAQSRLGDARGRLHRAQDTLATTRRQLSAARSADEQMQEALVAAQHELDQARRDVARGKADVAQQKDTIGNLALQNYQDGDPALMGLVAMLGAGDPNDLTTQLNAVHGVMAHQSQTLSHLRDVEAELVRQQARVAAARTAVAGRREAAAQHLTRTRALTDAAAEQEHAVAALVATRRSAADRAARVRAHDRQQLRRLQRQEARIKREILARARHQRNHVVGDTGGLLQRPVPGYVTSPYGWREHPIYHYWGLHDGDDFHAPCGTPEVAAGSGRVVSEYYSSVWGNRLYLDLGTINGHNFTVIYNHIERYVVGSGARVHRGQVLARAGTTGWSTGCHLHFTVMRDGNPVNPMDYM
ncbi:MAG: peptidoglycan DD-metalloendopeptidase family protein, partial [Marmoricola sp.]